MGGTRKCMSLEKGTIPIIVKAPMICNFTVQGSKETAEISGCNLKMECK